MLSAYVDPAQCPIVWDSARVVGASGLVGQLVAHLSQPALSIEERRRAEAVLWDVMVPPPTTTLSPLLPVDERARKVADALLADCHRSAHTRDVGRDVGASARTAETGMGFER
jgi:hypothetical protein